LEAIAAVHRLVAARLERHFRYTAALAAGRLEHFTALTAAHAAAATRIGTHLLARSAAIGATVGFVLETLAGIELLFTGGERKLTSAIDAVQHFINVH
jgi:hypothetical protein